MQSAQTDPNVADTQTMDLNAPVEGDMVDDIMWVVIALLF